MKKKTFLVLANLLCFCLCSLSGFAQDTPTKEASSGVMDSRIQSPQYILNCVKKGYIKEGRDYPVSPAIYSGPQISAPGVRTLESVDIPVFGSDCEYFLSSPSTATHQYSSHKNSHIFLGSTSIKKILTEETIDGASCQYTEDSCKTWQGSGAGIVGNNRGFQTMGINSAGQKNMGFAGEGITGMQLAKYISLGDTWKAQTICELNDTLHVNPCLLFQNDADSPYFRSGYFSMTYLRKNIMKTKIAISRYDTKKHKWLGTVPITNSFGDVYVDGSDLALGKDSEVYVTWAIYDSWPGQESALGFARSVDGGSSYSLKSRAIDNIKGLRNFNSFNKNFDVHSFPSIAVDKSDGEYSGNIYICWSNVGTPGLNYGFDVNVYVIISEDNGETWSEAIQVNTDKPLFGNFQFLPEIAVDDVSGDVSIVFYDDRNCSGNYAEVWVANSQDGGTDWSDFRVSDVKMGLAPINKLIPGYFSNCNSIEAHNGLVYPFWTDKRAGAMIYTSPYTLSQRGRPTNLTCTLLEPRTGYVRLKWDYDRPEDFDHYNIYYNDTLRYTSLQDNYSFYLPRYGLYNLKVTAAFQNDEESGPACESFQWGESILLIEPDSVYVTLAKGMSMQKVLDVKNDGQIPCKVDVATFVGADEPRLEYCAAKGRGHEYISRVSFANVDRSSGSNSYTDYNNDLVNLKSGKTYTLSVSVSKLDSEDRVFSWIDWNQDGVFQEDNSEKIELLQTRKKGYFETNITIPEDLPLIKTKMRIRLDYYNDIGPCGTTDYGEVEDYTISVNEWMTYDYSGSILPGYNSVETQVLLNSGGLPIGTYHAKIVYNSTSVNEPIKEVPITMVIVDNPFEIVVSSTPDELCKGQECQLNVAFEDVASAQIQWSHSNLNFSSTEQNPVAIPSMSGNYKVEVTKNGETAFGYTFVSVVDAFPVNLIPDTAFCPSHEYTLDAGYFVGADYLWSTGETTSSINIVSGNNYVETYSVELTHPTGCVSADEVQITWDPAACVGLPETSMIKGFDLYPNPANKQVRLAIYKQLSGSLNLEIYDMKGSLVYTSQEFYAGGDQMINLSSFDEGIYQVIIRSSDHMSIEKLVIE